VLRWPGPRPGPAPCRVPERVDERPGLLELSKFDQCLDLVGKEAEDARLPQANRGQPLDDRTEMGMGGSRVSERHLEESQG
jgi:hypothetical protein